MTEKSTRQIEDLVQTMRFLRSKNGCNWDRAQTPESLCPYILEEAYELVDAINAGDTAEILAELGDLLLQVVFQAQIHAERNLFDIGDIAAGITRKLRRRHPHIYPPEDGSTTTNDWEQIKQQELRDSGRPTHFSSRLPTNLPALKMASKVARHLRDSLPDTETASDPTPAPEEQHLAAEMFALVQKAQQYGIDSDMALRKYIQELLRDHDAHHDET